MDRIEIYQEIRSMQITYSFHFIFYLLLGVEHLLIILKLFWNSKFHLKLFISCSIIDLIFLIYPIIPLILMYRIILKKKLTKIFKLSSLIIILLSLVIGIIINISFWINLKATTSFSKECPYNLNDTNVFLGEEDYSERCLKRRCILESINNLEGYPYNYICNYNSQNEFEIDPNTQYPIKSNDGSTSYLKYYIQCQEKTTINELFTDKNNINNENEIYIYLQKCWNNNDINGFYLCQRYELPNTFIVNMNYKCPKDNYNVILYLCGIFLIVLDIIFAFIPWSLDYKSYSRILLFFNNENENLELDNNNEQERRHNETNTSSNNHPNLNNAERNNNAQEENNNINNDNNNNNIHGENNELNNENDFVHQPTETIIIVKDKKTINNSSNIKSSDRLNSGLNSNDFSKSNVNSNTNKRKNKKGKENIIGSMISHSESQNMISKTSEKENKSEDTLDNKKLLLNKDHINVISNNNKEIDDINFNNDIKYDEYKNNYDEDEKDIEGKKSNNNCLIRNKNININKKNIKKKIILLTKEDKVNINLKETSNSIKTTQKYKDQNYENDKNNDKSLKSENLENINHFEDINEIYRNKTPKKEIKSLNFNFSQVLTNLRDSDQITLFNNTNGSIIKEERKEETERSIREEEKNNNNLSKHMKTKTNLSALTPFKIKKKTKDKENNKEEKKFNTIDNKNENTSSLLIENSNKSEIHSQIKKDMKI